LSRGGETEINSGVEAFPSVFITSRLLFSGAAKNKTGSVARPENMHDGNDRDHETAFPKKYGQMAQQAHQLPHLLGQSKPRRTTKLSKLEFDTVNRTSPQIT